MLNISAQLEHPIEFDSSVKCVDCYYNEINPHTWYDKPQLGTVNIDARKEQRNQLLNRFLCFLNIIIRLTINWYKLAVDIV